MASTTRNPFLYEKKKNEKKVTVISILAIYSMLTVCSILGLCSMGTVCLMLSAC